MSLAHPLGLVNSHILSSAAFESIGTELSSAGLTTASGAWPVANKAIFVPVEVYEPLLIVRMFVENGAAVAGNVDVGIYGLSGNLVVSSGSTLQSGTSVIQQLDIIDTVLQAGLYYLAAAMSNVTGTVVRWNPTAAFAKSFGVCEMTSAFPLPATATFVTLTSAYIPAIYATQKDSI